MSAQLDNLLDYSVPELIQWCGNLGEKPFRAKQLAKWIHQSGMDNFDSMTDLAKSFRQNLNSRACIKAPSIISDNVSKDGTRKWLFDVGNGDAVETVFIPEERRGTLCVSSQAGCAVNCRFCSTGKQGFSRNLSTAEIVAQLWKANVLLREAGDRVYAQERPVTNVVMMGMGEPLLNSSAVLEAIRCLNDDLGIGQRRITVSTVGVPKTLPQLAELAMQRLGRAQFTLAVSLHAPNQRLREELIPTAHAYPYDALLEDCRHYLDVTGRRVSFEYILLGELNDQPEHAAELADRVGGFQSHVNLIAYNPIEEEEFKRPTPQRIEAFRRVLERRGVAVSLRASRGLDQNAACGQLRRQQMAPNSSGS